MVQSLGLQGLVFRGGGDPEIEVQDMQVLSQDGGGIRLGKCKMALQGQVGEGLHGTGLLSPEPPKSVNLVAETA